MIKLDLGISDIVEKGLKGNGLSREESTKLYGVDPLSPEAALVRWAAHDLCLRATNGKAEIHAQIGLNATVCPKNCKFCSFALCNGVREGKFELAKEDVLEYAKIYIEEGANLLLMLTTASYSFNKLVDMVGSVREVIPNDMPLLVNTDDMNIDQAKQLKAAGANGAYHAIRMREGEDTGIPVEKRWATFEALREAGLSLSTCVEPAGPEHTPEELTDATFRCIESGANSSGFGKRVAVPGTQLFERGMLTELEAAYGVAVYRLVTGFAPALNCSVASELSATSGGNLAWAEVGTNPRDTLERTENGGRGANIAKLKKSYLAAGWEIKEGPSEGWIL